MLIYTLTHEWMCVKHRHLTYKYVFYNALFVTVSLFLSLSLWFLSDFMLLPCKESSIQTIPDSVPGKRIESTATEVTSE